ncbi:MAG: cobalt ECF transporter T component CbiQ [Desulfuromonadales bacterium]|nr:cobalt ECF transporter T component CbiQ [Desulfuromonadales bacterium]
MDLPPFLNQNAHRPPPPLSGLAVRTPFLERGIHHLARITRESYLQWESSRRDGLLQRVDPRVKLLLLASFLVLVSLKRMLAPQLGIALLILLLFLGSRVDLAPLYRRILGAAFLFGVLVPLPSVLNLFTGGEPILPLLHLRRDYHLWLYHIPQTIGITREGLHGLALLTLRIANSVSFSLLVLHTTGFPELLKALRVLRVPESFIAVIALAYKYVFIFARTLEEMHLAKKSRLLGSLDAARTRGWAAERMAFFFHKTQGRCDEIFKAMRSRGFEHQVPGYTFRKLKSADWGAVLTAATVWLLFFYW